MQSQRVLLSLAGPSFASAASHLLAGPILLSLNPPPPSVKQGRVFVQMYQGRPALAFPPPSWRMGFPRGIHRGRAGVDTEEGGGAFRRDPLCW